MFTPEDRQKCAELFKKHYSGQKFHDDLYRDQIREHLRPGQRLLDAGCGRYLKFCKEFSPTAHVVGIDLESTLETDNQSTPFGVRGDLGSLPFVSEYFDILICRSVVEHLDEPVKVFREFWRVLKPGGKAIIITPNKYDYISLIAAVTPYQFHRKLVSRIFGSPEDDVFPTKYRANTVYAMRKTMLQAGFIEHHVDTINHYPAYLTFSPLLYRLGILYGRLTAMKMFRGLRASILCVYEKGTKPASEAHFVQRSDKANRAPIEVA